MDVNLIDLVKSFHFSDVLPCPFFRSRFRSRSLFQAVFNCKNRLRYSRERAPQTLDHRFRRSHLWTTYRLCRSPAARFSPSVILSPYLSKRLWLFSLLIEGRRIAGILMKVGKPRCRKWKTIPECTRRVSLLIAGITTPKRGHKIKRENIKT